MYFDEACDKDRLFGTQNVMQSVILDPELGKDYEIQVTPLTTFAVRCGKDYNYRYCIDDIQSHFDIDDILHTKPNYDAGTWSFTDDSTKYALVNIGITQQAYDIAETCGSIACDDVTGMDFVNYIAKDFADQKIDGKLNGQNVGWYCRNANKFIDENIINFDLAIAMRKYLEKIYGKTDLGKSWFEHISEDKDALFILPTASKIFDTVGPTIDIDEPQGWYKSNINLSVSLTDDNSISKCIFSNNGTELKTVFNPALSFAVSLDVSNLQTGDNSIVTTCFDNLGNSSEKDITAQIDTLHPEIEVVNFSDGDYINIDFVELKVIGTDAGSGIKQIKINNQYVAANMTDYFDVGFPIDSNTNNKIEIVSTDNVGNNILNTINIIHDSNAPMYYVEIIDDNGIPRSNHLRGTVTVNAFIKDENLNQYSCQIGYPKGYFDADSSYSASEKKCVYSFKWNTEYFDIHDIEQINIQAKDLAGNTLNKTYNINIDNNAPSVFSNDLNNLDSYINKESIKLDDIQVSDDSSLVWSKIEIFLNESSIGIFSPINFIGMYPTIDIQLIEGENNIKIIATDIAGNTNSENPFTKTFVKDTIKPNLKSVNRFEGHRFVNDFDIVFKYEDTNLEVVDLLLLSQLETMTCENDDISETIYGLSCTSKTYDIWGDMDNEYMTIIMAGVDKANNKSFDSRKFRIDNVAPSINDYCSDGAITLRLPQDCNNKPEHKIRKYIDFENKYDDVYFVDLNSEPYLNLRIKDGGTINNVTLSGHFIGTINLHPDGSKYNLRQEIYPQLNQLTTYTVKTKDVVGNEREKNYHIYVDEKGPEITKYEVHGFEQGWCDEGDSITIKYAFTDNGVGVDKVMFSIMYNDGSVYRTLQGPTYYGDAEGEILFRCPRERMACESTPAGNDCYNDYEFTTNIVAFDMFGYSSESTSRTYRKSE